MQPPRWTRQAAGTCVILALALAVTACATEAEPTGDSAEPAAGRSFVTRPDLSPPEIDVSITGPAGAEVAAEADLVFLVPKGDDSPLTGLLIVDSYGEPVWVDPLAGNSYDLRVQEYRGEPVLTWWRGEADKGHGEGEFVLTDSSYREVGTVTTSGTGADYHELTLTDAGTALLVSYPVVAQDLTGVGGPADGYAFDGRVQEVDVATGEVLFEWSALDHVPVTETQADITAEGTGEGTQERPFDYFHINAVTEDDDGSLLISARNTHAVYRVDRETGERDWTLGGSASDFTMDEDAYFAWQHDAQRHPDGTISLFDNQSDPSPAATSRGLKLEVDEGTWRASVAQEFLPRDDRRAQNQGNLQLRENGNVVIGWGAEPYYSEYAPTGELLLDADFGAGNNYRAYRLPWTATPSEPPRLVVRDGTGYVSWNGATEVAEWRFLAGDDAGSAEEVRTVARAGFETSAPVPDAPYVAAQALDATGTVLTVAERIM